MAEISFFGQVLSYEVAKKEGATKGYLRCYDAEKRRTFQIGITQSLDEASIPVTREKWYVSGVMISDGKTGTYMTCDAIQVLRDAPANGRRERQTEVSS